MLYKKFSETTNQVQKPLLLSKQKYKSILDLLIDEKAIQSAEQKSFCEYLKNGSKSMIKNWENIFSSKDKKENCTPKLHTLKSMEDNNLIENIRKKRKEKIEKAERMIQNLLAGPRELDSAAMFCEILKGRQIQLDFNKRMKEREKEEKVKENILFRAQAEPYLEEERRRVHLDLRRKEKFKKDVIEDIKEKTGQHEDFIKKKIEGEKKILELMKQEVQKHENVVKTAECFKKNRFKKEAIDDLKNKQQKAYKMAIEDKIEDKLNTAFLEKQHDIELATKSKENQRKYLRMRFIDDNAKKIIESIVDPAPAEEIRRLKKIQEETENYIQKQKAQAQKKKELQDQRVKDYQNYLRYKNNIDAKQKEIYNKEVINRLTNEKIYQDYLIQNRINKIKKHTGTEKILKDLMKEGKAAQNFEKLMDIKLNTINYDLQDKFFFQYANQLIKDAKEKGRPIFPLQKAIAAYEKANELNKKIVVPPHLRTNIVLNQ
ncbi:myosin heavy chain, clone 203-like [Condylostylus longicornis]|uniref:myosin heavy chain, clone 203-like n=1 Tax=Condylostylus longicornis TaxID=2530218 RepID=UPI00244DA2D0|nr:myosin heavy chain, clone 203-like [Condylostylus longicornis]